jgi:hypothetical protein
MLGTLLSLLPGTCAAEGSGLGDVAKIPKRQGSRPPRKREMRMSPIDMAPEAPPCKRSYDYEASYGKTQELAIKF